MRPSSLLLAFLLGLGGCQSFDIAEAEPGTEASAVETLRRGMPYSEAKALLELAGWQGLAFPAETAAQRCAGREECAVYPETESCSAPGQGVCRFGFAATTGERLAVTAVGTSPGTMRLNGWGYTG